MPALDDISRVVVLIIQLQHLQEGPCGSIKIYGRLQYAVVDGTERVNERPNSVAGVLPDYHHKISRVACLVAIY